MGGTIALIKFLQTQAVGGTMLENVISDACRGLSVTRKIRVTDVASVIRAYQ